MVIDLAKMCADDFRGRYLPYVQHYGLNGQIVLNAYTGNTTKYVDPRWNQLVRIEVMDERRSRTGPAHRSLGNETSTWPDASSSTRPSGASPNVQDAPACGTLGAAVSVEVDAALGLAAARPPATASILAR